MISTTEHSVQGCPEYPGRYVYRGVYFSVSPELRGKKGCYRTFGDSNISTVTRKQLLAAIDRYRYQAPTCSCWCGG